MQKQTLLIIIDNLKKGGAEVLLVGILPELNKKYELIIVTLSHECDFKNEDIICHKKYILGFRNKLSFISCIIKLKNIISRHKPSIIHAHLIYSSLVARLACPSTVPLVYSIHNELSKSDFNNSWLLTLIEKITTANRYSIIAVSKLVLKDYENTIRKTENSFILKNYISDQFFINPVPKKDSNTLRSLKIIAVGNIKAAKNYEYLLRSLIYLKDFPVSLDIYGNINHHLFHHLQSLINEYNLPVKFKGLTDDIQKIFSQYDLYVMSSKYEGFGIAAIEAMSCGLPLLLSDLPVLKEVTLNNALFFNSNNPLALANLIQEIAEGKIDVNKLSVSGIEIAKQYSKQNYLQELFLIYDKVIHRS